MRFTTNQLTACIKKNARLLDVALAKNPGTATLDAGRLLTALACIESGYGANCGPRYEKQYDNGGLYYERSGTVRKAVTRFGRWAACSYGPWQILYTTALELGLPEDTEPASLHHPDLCIPYVIAYLDRRAVNRPGIYKARDLAGIFDAYNTGRAHDANVPTAYIAKGLKAYEDPTPWIEAAKRRERRR